MVFHEFRADLKHAARLFSRQPVVLSLTIVGLAVGLGIATAVFSVMNAAVLRGEGLVDSARAPGVLRITDRSEATTWNYDEFLQLRQGATRLQVEAVLSDTAPLRMSSSESEPVPASVAFVSSGFFAATGGRATRGRALQPAETQPVDVRRCVKISGSFVERH